MSAPLTLRAEEVNSSKALINVDHIEQERWCPLLVDAGWYAFYQALCQGIEGEDGEEVYESYKEMSGAVEVESKSPLVNEGSQRRRGRHQRKKRDKISTLGRAPQRFNCCAGQSTKVCGRSALRPMLARGSCGIEVAMTCGRGVRVWSCRCGKRSLGIFWLHGTVCVHAQPLHSGASQRGMGRMARSSFSF